MYDVILVRYGEISLKGKNRSSFVNRLLQNIRQAVSDLGPFKISKTYGRIYVYPQSRVEDFLARLQWIPGIVSISPTVICPLDYQELEKTALDVFQEAVSGYPVTFKVETRRANKNFPRKSPEISRDLGAYLLDKINGEDGGGSRLSVDVHQPDYTLNVEIRKRNIYIYTRIIPGPGGLPVGSSGRGLLLLSGGIDSPVAGWLGMKRGIEVEALYFHSHPFTSDRAREKVIELARILSGYSGKLQLHICHFTDIQQEIRKNCPARYLITIMRRMMLRLAERVARQNDHLVLLTGESVGQVASQTLESINVINAVTSFPVLRPLITADKTEIMDIARDIGTYETSILPYEDCCTIFIPEHPVTKPRLKEAEEAEAVLPVEDLLAEALAKTETLTIRPSAADRAGQESQQT